MMLGYADDLEEAQQMPDWAEFDSAARAIYRFMKPEPLTGTSLEDFDKELRSLTDAERRSRAIEARERMRARAVEALHLQLTDGDLKRLRKEWEDWRADLALARYRKWCEMPTVGPYGARLFAGPLRPEEERVWTGRRSQRTSVEALLKAP